MADPLPIVSRRRFLKGVLASGAVSAAALTFGSGTIASATPQPVSNAACDAVYEACVAYCRTRRFKAVRAICYSACMDAWVKCKTLSLLIDVKEVVLEAGSDAAQWLRNHPEVVIGTIIVVGTITMVVVAGPAGGLVLVAI